MNIFQHFSKVIRINGHIFKLWLGASIHRLVCLSVGPQQKIGHRCAWPVFKTKLVEIAQLNTIEYKPAVSGQINSTH